ncbi:MAG: lysylphosphatidylglycerol synthase transmembrane domain-containing protein [Flavobacteriia bacterium]|jgi:uncharacterized membrane protein YbhN (UPF0104 family)
MTKKALLVVVKTVLPLLLGFYLIWVFFSGMSAEAKALFYQAIREANYFWIILSMVIGVLAYLSRAYRWKYVLEPIGYSTQFWNRYHAIMIGYIVNLTIPRAGEASRSAMLYRSDGVPFSSSFGTIIAERAIDLVMLGLIAIVTAFIGYADFFEIKALIINEFGGVKGSVKSGFPWKIVVFSLVLAIGLVFTYLFMFRLAFRTKLIEFGKDVLKGLVSIFKSKNPGAYVFHTLFIWGCYIAMFALPFQSLHQTTDISFPGILLAFIAGSLGITFTNGGIGTYPLLVGLVVAFYIGKQYPEDAQAIGNALGMLIWVTQTLLMILLGLISLVLLPKNYSKENEPS